MTKFFSERCPQNLACWKTIDWCECARMACRAIEIAKAEAELALEHDQHFLKIDGREG